MKSSPQSGRRLSPAGIISAALLGALFLVNVSPIALVIRQALTPERLSARWPLQAIPAELNLENLSTLWQTQSLAGHLFLSLFVAAVVTLLSLAVGFPAGWAAARLQILDRVAVQSALLSRMLPPITIAIPLTSILIPVGLYDHPLGFGLILAHLTTGVPVAVLIAYAAFRTVPLELEDAARVDGCSTLGAFVRVALPSAVGAVGSASVVIFLFSWDELTYALLLQLINRTMPPLIYYYTEYGQLGVASMLAMIMLMPAIIVIVISQRFLVRGILAGGIKG